MHNDTPLSEDQHQRISSSLPWYLTQSMEPAERQQVENHIRDCLLCRRELADLVKLAAAVKEVSDCNLAADASFNRLRAKMQTARQPAESCGKYRSNDQAKQRAAGNLHLIVNAASSQKPSSKSQGNRYKRFTLPAMLLLATIPFAAQYQPSPTVYHKLSVTSPRPEKGIRLRVAFSTSISDVDLDTLLTKIHGKRLAGPNRDGAYTISLDADQEASGLASAIGFLRSQPNVASVKPLLPP